MCSLIVVHFAGKLDEDSLYVVRSYRTVAYGAKGQLLIKKKTCNMICSNKNLIKTI